MTIITMLYAVPESKMSRQRSLAAHLVRRNVKYIQAKIPLEILSLVGVNAL